MYTKHFSSVVSTVAVAGSLLLTGCAGRASTAHQQPQLMLVSAEQPAQRQSVPVQPRPAGQRNLEGRIQRLPEVIAQGEALTITLPAELEQIEPIPAYDATQMLTVFAQSYLGITPTIVRAQGASGDVTLPPEISQEINGSIALAGQISAGVITQGSYRGAAEVAVGSGSISGDLQADISSASLGAYSLLMPGVPLPSDANAALNLIRSTYPALGNIDLQAESGGQGYVFRAVTTTPGIDWETKQPTAVTQVFVAGVSGQGRAVVVWVAVGNGTFAIVL